MRGKPYYSEERAPEADGRRATPAPVRPRVREEQHAS
jgi:hypothetical protein